MGLLIWKKSPVDFSTGVFFGLRRELFDFAILSPQDEHTKVASRNLVQHWCLCANCEELRCVCAETFLHHSNGNFWPSLALSDDDLQDRAECAQVVLDGHDAAERLGDVIQTSLLSSVRFKFCAGKWRRTKNPQKQARHNYLVLPHAPWISFRSPDFSELRGRNFRHRLLKHPIH